MADDTTARLKSAPAIKELIENEIKRVIAKHDALLDRKIYPDGSNNEFKHAEGQMLLYHIGVLSELLCLIKEVNNDVEQ